MPVTLRLAAGVTLVEALGAVGVGGWLVGEALVQRPAGLAIALSSGIFVLVAGVVLALLAWGLFRAQRWSRSPTVVCQLLMLPLGYELLSGSTTAVGVGMLVTAVVTLVLVLAPPSTAVFR